MVAKESVKRKHSVCSNNNVHHLNICFVSSCSILEIRTGGMIVDDEKLDINRKMFRPTVRRNQVMKYE